MKTTELHVAVCSRDIYTGEAMSLDERIEDFGILTPEELMVCELAGVDPATMAQFCKDEKEGKTAKLILASYTVDEQ